MSSRHFVNLGIKLSPTDTMTQSTKTKSEQDPETYYEYLLNIYNHEGWLAATKVGEDWLILEEWAQSISMKMPLQNLIEIQERMEMIIEDPEQFKLHQEGFPKMIYNSIYWALTKRSSDLNKFKKTIDSPNETYYPSIGINL